MITSHKARREAGSNPLCWLLKKAFLRFTRFFCLVFIYLLNNIFFHSLFFSHYVLIRTHFLLRGYVVGSSSNTILGRPINAIAIERRRCTQKRMSECAIIPIISATQLFVWKIRKPTHYLLSCHHCIVSIIWIVHATNLLVRANSSLLVSNDCHCFFWRIQIRVKKQK
jgi:hypothetical protein